jgi:murE/murF fusion protein
MSSSKFQIKLESLLLGLNFELLSCPEGLSFRDQRVVSVTADSREAFPGSVFVAVKGGRDGHDYIGQAVDNGCTAIICTSGRLTSDQAKDLHVTVIELRDTAKAYAAMAANYFGRPGEKLRLIAVTGTNGKTTITYLFEHVLVEAGFSVGVIGTVNNRYTTKSGEKKILSTRFTTPEALLLQELLREMVDKGVEYVVMEVSSHALAQSRADTLLFDVAAFTNLSRDHLDYHGDMEEYFQVKLRLFSDHMKDGGIAVLPHLQQGAGNQEWLVTLHALCAKSCQSIIGWGEGGEARVRLVRFSSSLNRTDIVVDTSTGRHEISSPLVGGFNVENILSVLGLGSAMGISESEMCDALATATGAPGRLERVTPGVGWDSKGPLVLVDYAHTPDALEKVLTAAQELPHGNLFCVFGCGGNRDTGKRAVMGEIAAKICDIALVTDDNPRTEDPDQIVSQILVGMDNSPMEVKDEAWLAVKKVNDRGCVVIRDRKKAIEAAVRSGAPEDIVVIAGKGHEPYQLTVDGKRFFDDRLAAKSVLFSWTAELVRIAVGGTLPGDETPSKMLGPVITDSRSTSRDGIFIALKGDNHDAHDYLQQAVANGAVCLVVEKEMSLPPGSHVCQIVVKDTLQALGDLASFRRKQLAEECDQLVIGLTGSCGKTTVKEMTAAILSRKWPEGPDFPADSVLKTKGNFNNLIGLPLSLLPLDTHHKAAVLEMGMNQPGELRRLGEIGWPDISCITNIHGAHLEGLHSIEGVAKAKEELFEVTKHGGTLVINLDDPRVRRLSASYEQHKLTFTTKEEEKGEADLWASGISMEAGRGITFTLHHGEETAEVHLYIAGEHNVSNALCAAAIGVATGAELKDIVAGLADFRPPDKRMEMLPARAGFTILNDTYNANPASMAAGIKTLKQIAGRSSVAVIGDMLELGETAGQAHYSVGKLIAELAIDSVAVVGTYKDDVLQGALDHGFDESHIRVFDDKEDACGWINQKIYRNMLGQDDVVLVKASRGLRFETIVAKIIDC